MVVDSEGYDWCLGVQFDEYIDGHNVDGKGAIGYCRWVRPREVDRVKSDEWALDPDFTDLLLGVVLHEA